MSKKNKTHGVQLLIRTVVTDPKGKVIHDSGQEKAKSFVIQFLEFLYRMAYNPANNVGVATDVLGAESVIWHGGGLAFVETVFRFDAGINDDTHGIVVGTGNTPADNTDNKLETQLTEGVGAGNITHGAQIIDAVAVVGANVDIELKRSFPNNTGSTIIIREAGAYVYNQATKHHCIIRDVLGVPVNLPDKCSLTVYYTMRTTV